MTTFNRLWLAEAEINSMETGLIAVMADAGCKDFHSFFDMDEFERVRDSEMERTGEDAFAASVRIYSTIVPILLKHGNDTGEVLAASSETDHLRDLIPPYVLRRLGNTYIDGVTFEDPWGAPYQFYFGPWRTEQGPFPLRIYKDTAGSFQPDALTVPTTQGATVVKRTGLPPRGSDPYYIWSLGKNGQSDQAIFDPTGQYAGPPSNHYRPNADPADLGGGDDINNWDPNRSYERFYR